MKLGFGIRFGDLYGREGLMRLDQAFLRFLRESDAVLHERLLAARQTPQKLAAKEESDLLVALAPHVEDFLPKLFGIEAEARALAEKHNELAPLYSVKRQFVQRRALHKIKPEEMGAVDPRALEDRLFGGPFTELQFAKKVSGWLQNEAAHAEQLEAAARYAAWASATPQGREKHRAGVLFKAPRKLDYMRLVPVYTEAKNGFPEHSLQHLRHRDGFKLTDSGTDLVGALDEANYCIWCHEQGKDSCSKGLKEKAPADGFRKTPFGVALAGCPLEQKISEFHMVKARGEPLAASLSGVDPLGNRAVFQPIKNAERLREDLDHRVMAGFGGVAEYGITVRWDKNFLKVIRLLLERRRQFAMFGGVRFGGTLSVDDAFADGFDHVALCAGAGRPTVLEIPNGFARGVRAASDFLMALQLTGAAKRESIANLQIRLPVVVVGGGLTAIDTATESLAYYAVQVEKFLARYEQLGADISWSAEERQIAEEFLAHARALRAARPEERLGLLKSWGGVTIAYRRRLVDSPSYTLNHEEVEKALEEGIVFAEGLTPERIEVDHYGHANAVAFQNGIRLPAKSVLIAAGTQPNTVLAREEGVSLVLDGKYFQACDEAGQPLKPERHAAKPLRPDVLLHRRNDGRFMSFFGDLHPSYFGNVVKAMGSAKQGYPVVSRVVSMKEPSSAIDDTAFLARLNRDLRAVVHEVRRLTPRIVEVVRRAPVAARRVHPGQFYRMQNFETLAQRVPGTTLAMEGLALTGAWVDRQKGLISVIALEMGGSADLLAYLRPGEPVVLMGPTGTPTEIPRGANVVLAGGGLGNAVLFSIGRALRAAGSKVIYFAGYKQMSDRYRIDDIEASSDVVVWCCDEPPGFAPRRPQDRSFVGNIVQGMRAYAAGALGTQPIPFSATDRIIAIGSDGMMAAVAEARHGVLKEYLKPSHVAIGSINSPMQCMMKEICAQCLQPHVDPQTGKTSYVFSCFNQDQPLDQVDFGALAQRLAQNGVQEKLTALWIWRCLNQLPPERKAA